MIAKQEVSTHIELPLSAIRTDGGTQPRAVLDQDKVNEYALLMLEGVVFPSVIAFYDGADYWLADGFHRYGAARQICRETINIEIKQGTRREAVLYAMEANTRHGIPLALADRKRCATTLLNDEEWTRWSDREIGRRCGLNHETVGTIRQELSGGNRQIERLVERNGTTYTMNAANVGYGISELYSRPQGQPTLYTIPVDESEEEKDHQWLYNPETHEAYCKYCYKTHRLWEHFHDVFPGEHVWECQVCQHRTKDEYMQTEGGRTVRTPVEMDRMSHDDYPLEEAKEKRDAHVMRVMGSSDSPEWYTPQDIVRLSIELLGEIDLDPCSNSHESPNIPAGKLYTKEDDGLTQYWEGKVYLNPPYGSEIPQWVEKLVNSYGHGVTEAIALLPARIDTIWFQPLYKFPMCNVRGRIQYENSPYHAPFPCVIVYLGERVDDFVKTFKDRGPIMRRIG